MTSFPPPDPPPSVEAAFVPSAGVATRRPPLPTRPTGPWGPWATVGWLLLSLAIGLGVSIPVAMVWFLIDVVRRGEMTPEGSPSMFTMEMAVAGVSQVGTMGGVILFAWLRKSMTLRNYFALRRVRWTAAVYAVLAMVVWLGFESGVNWFTDAPLPEFMVQLVSVPAILPLIWLIVVILAPVCEEFVFRGFMWRGLIDTKIGLHGTVLATSLPWTLLHLGQYGLIDMTLIFLTGLLFGYARHLSGSLWIPMMMHLLMNLVAMSIITGLWATGQL